MGNASEKRSYEEKWKEAFEQAEMSPSSNLWSKIDQQLTAQESGMYKRGFFFYRAVAAALLLCIAGLGWFTYTHLDSSEQLVSQKDVIPENPDRIEENRNQQSAEIDVPSSISESDQIASSKNEFATSASPSDANTSESGSQLSGGNDFQKETNNEKETAIANNTTADNKATKMLIFPNEEVSERGAYALSTDNRVGRVSALPPDAVALNEPTWFEEVEKLFLVPQYRQEAIENNEKKGLHVFAGLAMAPSVFDPNFQPQGHASPNFATADVPQSPNGYSSAENFFLARVNDSYAANSGVVEEGLNNQSSLSISYGFNFGLELGKHWSIESGLDYQNFQTTTETRYTVVDLSTGERYPLVATNALANRATANNTTPIGAPSEVDNQFQFISIPIQVGYNVRFTNVTISINPGVAANLFLGNRISSEQYSSSIISRDGSSPFSSQYFSGLISSGVYYQLVENYSLSFTPSYQFALTDLANSEANFSSQPQSFGLRLGFRYTFQ